MKNKYLVSALLMLISPAISQAAAVDWTSQKYNLYAYLDIDEPEQPVGLPQLDMTAFSLAGLPNISSATLTTANAVATASSLGIKNLSNSTQDIIELSLNAFSSYSGGTDSFAQYSYVVPSVSIGNTFVADSNVLTVTYDFNSLIALTAPTVGQLSYNGLFIGLEVTEEVSGASQFLNFVDNNFVFAETNQTFSGSGTALFNVTPGKTYSISADISPDLFTSGSVTENSSNSVLTLGFSNRAVTAVPEPETYAMLLAGLALVGFSARRKTQA